MKGILAGTYWLVANGDVRRAICKGRKPKEIEKSGRVYTYESEHTKENSKTS